MVDDLAWLGVAIPQTAAIASGRRAASARTAGDAAPALHSLREALGLLLLMLIAWIGMHALKRAGRAC